MPPYVQNDWEVAMIWCVHISVSDQSPRRNGCNNEDVRKQVVRYLSNSFLKQIFEMDIAVPMHMGLEK